MHAIYTKATKTKPAYEINCPFQILTMSFPFGWRSGKTLIMGIMIPLLDDSLM